MQQGRSPAFYRDHPQDIRHRTVQSRKPPPINTHLIKGDPDSATSPSKYRKSAAAAAAAVEFNAASATAVDQAEAEKILGISQDEGFGELLLSDDDDDSKLKSVKKKANLTTSDSEESLGNRPRRKPKKKRKDKPGLLKTPSSPSKGKSLRSPGNSSNNNHQSDDHEANKKNAKELKYFGSSVDGPVSHFQIESFIHRSKANFNIEDVKAALDNAKIIGDTDKEIDLGGKAKRVKDAQALKVAKKWRVLAEKVKREHGRLGLDELDDKLNKIDSPGAQSPRQKPSSPKRRTSQSAQLPPLQNSMSRSQLLQKSNSRLNLQPGPSKTPSKTSSIQMGPPKPTGDPAEGSRRMELLKAARKVQSNVKMKQITSKMMPSDKDKKQEPDEPLKKIIVGRAGLPLLTRRDKMSKAQLKTEGEAEKSFYKDFRIIYVEVPVPTDEYPREYAEATKQTTLKKKRDHRSRPWPKIGISLLF